MSKTYPRSMDVDQIREEVNTKNVLAVIDYTKTTRELVIAQEAAISHLGAEVRELRSQVDSLLTAIGILRGQLLGGGPTS